MKKILFSLFLIFGMLSACGSSEGGEDDTMDAQKNEQDPKYTELVREVENEDVKLIVKREKNSYSSDEKIQFEAEIHNVSADEEITVYTNSTLIDFHLTSEENEFDLANEAQDESHIRTIKKGEPYKETIEFDKEDPSFGNLLENMNAGTYKIIFTVSYGKENYTENNQLFTELEFQITE